MSLSPVGPATPAGPSGHRGPLRPVAGVLPDGTPHYAPVGELRTDGDTVCCHLCGRWFRSVAAHLPSHGWTPQSYREAFGLEHSRVLEAESTRKRRAAGLAPRLLFEPAMREGARAGRERARTGSLAADAAAAARGRRHPAERRAKTLAALAAVDPEAVAAANRERGRQHREQVAARAAARVGEPDLVGYVRRRAESGDSLATIERAAGLTRNWLTRHLAELDPQAGRDLLRHRPRAAEQRCRETAAALGFADLAAYLRHRRDAGAGVSAIAAECRVSRSVVAALLAASP